MCERQSAYLFSLFATRGDLQLDRDGRLLRTDTHGQLVSYCTRGPPPWINFAAPFWVDRKIFLSSQPLSISPIRAERRPCRASRRTVAQIPKQRSSLRPCYCSQHCSGRSPSATSGQTRTVLLQYSKGRCSALRLYRDELGHDANMRIIKT